MDRYAVIGHPVKHSRSPRIHALFAAQTGQTLDYDRLESAPEAFTQTVLAFAASGARGCNITVPFKFEAWQMAAHRTARAELAQSANTLRFDAGGWWADNTDGIGLVRDITQNAGVTLAGQRVLLIGAGGAAAGSLGPLIDTQPAEIVVANRSVAKAEALVVRHQDWAAAQGVRLHATDLDHAGEAFDGVINATASSLGGAESPVRAGVLKPGALALDMMYGAAAAGFLAWAETHGAHGRDGLGMLVEQAAEAFTAWRGVRPDTGPVLAQLRTEL
ncbi:MAG: shikimate dehydrogenase [Leptothrix ochracea]|uniref:shikimate dehydrogenase n=1 Tax=Leptothrix ochracea TaxID=735331 RepID=UPI0034E1C1CE